MKFHRLLLFLFLTGCATTDPGEGVSHIHLGKYAVELTFGPLFTLVIAPIIVYFVTKKIGKLLDAHEELQIQKHKEIVGKIDEAKFRVEENRVLLMNKIDEHCKTQEKLHASLDKRFWYHRHEIVKDKETGSVEVGDIIIKGDLGSF